MPFRDRFVVTGKLNGKFYFHKDGREVYGRNEAEQVARSLSHLRYDILSPNISEFSNYAFLLGALGGKDGKRTVDVLGFRDIEQWPGSPEIDAFVSVEGVFRPDEDSFTRLEGGVIVLKKELELQAESPSLYAFLSAPMPDTPLTLGGETYRIIL